MQMSEERRLHVIRPGPDQYGIIGQAHAGEPLYYPQCGLPIYLLNGFKREVIDGDEAVTIENLDGLWTAIGLFLVSKKKQLSPQEVKFLRHHMNLTQAELGQILRVTDQTVARWEKGQVTLEGTADVALRSAFLMSPAVQPDGRAIAGAWFNVMKDLTEAEDCTPVSLTFRREQNGWVQPRAA
jgi:putative transcriptional regulator